MTIDQMRAVLGLDENVGDSDVTAAYATYLLTASPAAEPITVAEAKAQLGIEEGNTTDDPKIAGYIIAAREYAESYTGLILTARPVVETVDRLTSFIDLYAWPIRSHPVVSYLNADGVPQIIDDVNYYAPFSRRPVRISTQTAQAWPTVPSIPGSITITVDAGYATPEEVPQSIKQAMLLIVRHWFDNASAVVVGGSGVGASEVPMGAHTLLDRYRFQTV